MVSENDVQRLFLQAIISRRVVTKKLAQILWERCINAVKSQSFVRGVLKRSDSDATHRAAANERLQIAYSNDRGAWDRFVGQINTSIDPLDLEFRHFHDEVTGADMYALVTHFLSYPDMIWLFTVFVPGQ